MTSVALSAARFLGRSRKLALFGGLVAIAGVVNELQLRKERDSNSQDEA